MDQVVSVKKYAELDLLKTPEESPNNINFQGE